MTLNLDGSFASAKEAAGFFQRCRQTDSMSAWMKAVWLDPTRARTASKDQFIRAYRVGWGLMLIEAVASKRLTALAVPPATLTY
jgi:hypothetical protein